MNSLFVTLGVWDTTRVWELLRPYWETGLAKNTAGVGLVCAWGLIALLVAVWVKRRFDPPRWAVLAGLRIVHAGWVIIAFRWIAYGNTAWFASWVVVIFFLLLNVAARKMKFARSLLDEHEPEPPLGNMWAVFALVWLWWKPGLQFVAMSGVFAVAWGESAAIVGGRLFGKHRFRFRGARGLTFEAAAIMAAVTFLALLVTVHECARIPTWHVPRFWLWAWAFFGAALTTGVATVAYLYTPRPWQRWTIPLGTAVTMYYYAVTGFHM